MDVTESQLAAALDTFYLHVNWRGTVVHGTIAYPDEVAGVLYATLDRMAALREPDAEKASGT